MDIQKDHKKQEQDKFTLFIVQLSDS